MWSLQYENQIYAFESAKISSLKRKLVNQGSDTVSFKQALPNTLNLKAHTSIRILKENTPWFYGIITKLENTTTASESYQTCHISGPWWHLEHLVFQQAWLQNKTPNEAEPTLESIYKGRLILGQSLDGAALSVEEQIKEILHYAITAGAPFQVGSLGLNFNIPFDEVKDISCAEAIQRLLRWSPDTVLYFDYATLPLPTLHLRPRSQMPSLDLEYSKLHTLQISPRYDLQVPSVWLKYEKTHKSDNDSWTSTEVDAYPEGSSGQEFNAMVLTIDLVGSRSTRIKQKISTRPIDAGSIAWWQSQIPFLASLPEAAITLHSFSRKSTLPFELVEGAIAPWMHVEAEADVVRATLSYETQETVLHQQEVAIRLIATSSESKTFKKTLTLHSPEATPQGLAAILYHSLHTLQYEGRLSLYGPSLEAPMGSVLNIQGGDPSYTNMHAVLQEIHENLENQKTTLIFGPPKHLGPTDLVELLRMGRRRHFSRSASTRQHGYIPAQTSIEQGIHTPLQNTTFSYGNYQKLTFKHPEHDNTFIQLDARPLGEDLQITLRSEMVCQNGELKERLVLASQPFDLPPDFFEEDNTPLPDDL